MKEAAPKGTFENINGLLGIMVWPVLLILAFIFYRKEITTFVQLLLTKLEQSSKITVWSLSIEIDKTAKSYGDEKLGKIIKNLSENGIKQLMILGGGSRHIIMSHGRFDQSDNEHMILPYKFPVLLELEKEHLITADEPLSNFQAFFHSLRPVAKAQFMGKDETSSDRRRNATDEEYNRYTIERSTIDAADWERLNKLGIRLSESGNKAFNIIVQVISRQISRE